MTGNVVYHWKHGWIPLDHVAALSKAKGNHAAAARMLADAHDGTHGFHSRQDVAKGVLDLPHVPSEHRAAAVAQLRAGAAHHGATDLLPGHRKQTGVTPSSTAPHTSVSELFDRSRMTPQQERAHVQAVNDQLAAGRAATEASQATADAQGITDQHRAMTNAELEIAAKRSPIPAFKRGAQAELARRLDAVKPATPATLSTEELDAEVVKLAQAGDYGPRFQQLAEEMDRRDAVKNQPTIPSQPDPIAEQEALNKLLFGDRKAWQAAQAEKRAARRDPERVMRDEYDAMVHTQWLRAEEETRGHMLSREGEAALARGEFTTLDLFTRKRSSLQYASEELQRWFAEPGNQRLSFPEFRSGAATDRRAREAGKRLRNRGFESEFG